MWDVECIVVTNKTISANILLLLFLLYWRKKKSLLITCPRTSFFLCLSLSFTQDWFLIFFFSKLITYHLKLWLQSINYMIIRAFHLTDLPEIKMNRSPVNLNSNLLTVVSLQTCMILLLHWKTKGDAYNIQGALKLKKLQKYHYKSPFSHTKSNISNVIILFIYFYIFDRHFFFFVWICTKIFFSVTAISATWSFELKI